MTSRVAAVAPPSAVLLPSQAPRHVRDPWGARDGAGRRNPPRCRYAALYTGRQAAQRVTLRNAGSGISGGDSGGGGSNGSGGGGFGSNSFG